MADKNNALQIILNGNFKKGFGELAEAFKSDGADENLISELREAFYVPNLGQLAQNFRNNSKLLQDYPYIFEKHFTEPELNRYILFPLDENLYYAYDKQKKKLFPMEVSSDRETKYFFKDLDNPLLVENEFNEFNLKFLDDNVRDSRDFAGDNHIYLWYENADMFSLLLYYSDLKPLLERKKFVFLIGDEREKYPINFKNEFGIDYSSYAQKEIELDDIKRMVFGWKTMNEAGTTFLANIMDFHSDLITVPDCLLKMNFPTYFQEQLIGKPLNEAIFLLRNLSDKDEKKSWVISLLRGNKNIGVKDITSSKFLDELSIVLKNKPMPTPKEWLTGIYLAYSRCRKREFKGRVVPALFVYPHDDIFYLCGMAREQLDLYFSIVSEFAYHKVITLIRDPITHAGSTIRFMTKTHPKALNANGEIQLDPYYCFAFGCFLPKDIFFIKQHPLFPDMRVIRFEDLKLNPEATLSSLAEFLNIPLSPSLYNTTFCGVTTQDRNSNGEYLFNGFDTKPVYNEHKEYFSVFDKYRIEMARSKEYEYYGYKPMYYDGQVFYDEDKIRMMSIPFLFESMKTAVLPNAIKSGKVSGMNFIKYMLSIKQFPFRVSGINGDIVPIPWLKPKNELLRVPIYTNVAEALKYKNQKEDDT